MPIVPHMGPPAGVVGGLFLWLAVLGCPVLPSAAAEGGVPAYRIVINLPSRTLSLYTGEALIRRYPVAIGHPSTPSPQGSYRVAVKVVNPTWYPKQKPPVPPGPENPVGTRWLGLDAPNLGVHGTNAPGFIGQAVSGGCIRMHNGDVEELYSLVDLGTPVEFTYETVEIGRLPADGGSPGPGGEAALLYSYALAVYPDIYGKGAATVRQVREKLRAAGITAGLDRRSLAGQVRRASGTFEPLPAIPRVVVEERPAKQVRWEEGRLWLPLAEAADLVGAPFPGGEGEVSERDGVEWVAVAEVARQRGFRVRVVPAEATLYLTTPPVFWKGTPVARAFSEGESVLVPVGPLAAALGRPLAFDSSGTMAMGEGGRITPVLWRGEEAYLPPAAAASLFAVEVSVTPEGVWFRERPSEEPGEQLRGQLDL